MSIKWYLKPEAKALLIRAALGEVEWDRHVKTYALSRDEWTTPEGDVADALRAFVDKLLWSENHSREYLIERGATVTVDDAIEFACGWTISTRCVDLPADFHPILDAVEAARSMKEAA